MERIIEDQSCASYLLFDAKNETFRPARNGVFVPIHDDEDDFADVKQFKKGKGGQI